MPPKTLALIHQHREPDQRAPFLRGLGLVQRQEGERDRRVVVLGGPRAPRRRSGCSAGSAGWSIFHLPPSQSDMRRRRPYKIE